MDSYSCSNLIGLISFVKLVYCWKPIQVWQDSITRICTVSIQLSWVILLKKLLLILFIIPNLVVASESANYKINLWPHGPNEYSVSIIDNTKRYNYDQDIEEKEAIKKEYKKLVNKTCGTRFEIVDMDLGHIDWGDDFGNKMEYITLSLQGYFKCYANSQM